MLRGADIRDGLCDFLEAKFGKIRFFEELTMGKSRADIVMIRDCGLYSPYAWAGVKAIGNNKDASDIIALLVPSNVEKLIREYSENPVVHV